MHTLDRIPLHRAVQITDIASGGPATAQIMAMGLLPGARVKVVGVAPLGDPLLIQSAGCRVSIRRADAAAITVALD